MTGTKKVLLLVTNHGTIEGTDKNTGWYLPELAHPYYRFTSAGYQVDLASIKGGACPVAQSSLNLADEENKLFWESAETQALVQHTFKLSDVDVHSYDVFFFVGGFGVMWDFPFDSAVAEAARVVYEKGGVVGGVCHGPIGLANVKLSNGDYLVAGKEVTAFCNEEEAFVTDLSSELPMHAGLGQTCEDVLSARGAKFTKTSPWGVHVAHTDRLFTGQNPASAGPVAEAIVAALSK